jgi:hypothetical protein
MNVHRVVGFHPRAAGSTGTALIALSLLLAVLILPGSGVAAGTTRPDLSKVHVLAIAPFADEAALSRPLADYGAARLGELMKRGGFQIVDSSRVAEEMKRLGITSRDLISPAKTFALGTQVGADAIITGRVTQLVTEAYDLGVGDRPRGGPITSRVDVDIRLLDVGSRVNLFQDTFICDTLGLPANAMECAVRDAVARLLPGRN